ncbi:MAG: hypothetical protein Q9170_001383 [Blastenia crenularia]
MLQQPTIGSVGYRMREEDLELLYRFQARTMFTITMGEPLATYRTQGIALASTVLLPLPHPSSIPSLCLYKKLTKMEWQQYPYFLHTILALTLLHDRRLLSSSCKIPDPRILSLEANHTQAALTSFATTISNLVSPTSTSRSNTCPSFFECTAIWGTSSLLGFLAFASFDTLSPSLTWPLAPSTPTDLNWLRLIEGRSQIEKVVPPPGEIMAMGASDGVVLDESCSALPRAMVQLCELRENGVVTKGEHGHGDGEESEESPYAHALSALSPVLEIREGAYQAIIGAFWKYTSHMRPALRRLLEDKDERALLILAWWYAKLCQVKGWWLLRRAKVEGEAICEMLEQRWGGRYRPGSEEKWQYHRVERQWRRRDSDGDRIIMWEVGEDDGNAGLKLLDWPRRMFEQADF